MNGGACWNCGAALAAGDYRRGDICAECRYETRCCRNCEFYDPSHNNACRETAAEPVPDKEKSNFCEYFQVSAKSHPEKSAGPTHPTTSTSSAKAALDALFKKKKT